MNQTNTHSNSLPDVQSVADTRNIAITRVGVKSITHPVLLQTLDSVQASIAHIDMYVGLAAHLKGTHMSRFLEILQAEKAPISFKSIRAMLTKMLTHLEAVDGYIQMRMPYFIEKAAPVSGVKSLLDYQVTITIEQKNGILTHIQQVVVPVTSLCPCSKKISEYGAHNQRSHVTIAAELVDAVNVEELIRLAEEQASCELYGLLKRPDEKYVTERAYDNPKFVEDMVRDIALQLNRDQRIIAYTVESENFESIHNHSAYAMIYVPNAV